jgi:hypothetical protein
VPAPLAAQRAPVEASPHRHPSPREVDVIEYRIGDVFDQLARIPDGSIDLLVTSPPFLELRSYLPADHPDKAKEIGGEPTPAAFIDTMLALTAEWGRVLAPHGSICVELGDTYSGSGGAGGDYRDGGMRAGQQAFEGSAKRQRKANGYVDRDATPRPARDARHHRGGDDDHMRRYAAGKRDTPQPGWPLAKSIAGIPHAYLLSLIYGWNLLDRGADDSPAGLWRARNYICWARPNPTVGSLGKRNVEKGTGDSKFRPATSYITVACRGRHRFFDLEAVRVPASPNTNPRTARGVEARPNDTKVPPNGSNRGTLAIQHHHATRPPYDWHADEHPEDGDWLWKLATYAYPGSHYATFPMELPKRLILAMCPQRVCTTCGRPSERIVAVEHEPNRTTNGPQSIERKHLDGGSAGYDVRADRVATTVGWTDCGHDTWRPGVVLDPFAGSGTTLEAALTLGRDAIGIDLDDRNVELARERVGMFLTVV